MFNSSAVQSPQSNVKVPFVVGIVLAVPFGVFPEYNCTNLDEAVPVTYALTVQVIDFIMTLLGIDMSKL